MGFNGLLITDDLSDASLNKVCTQDEAAVAAVKAGMSNAFMFQQALRAVIMQCCLQLTVARYRQKIR